MYISDDDNLWEYWEPSEEEEREAWDRYMEEGEKKNRWKPKPQDSSKQQKPQSEVTKADDALHNILEHAKKKKQEQSVDWGCIVSILFLVVFLLGLFRVCG